MVASTQRVEVLLFGRLRECAGRERWELPLPDEATIASVWRLVSERVPGLEASRPFVRPALNEALAGWEEPIRPDDRIAFLPPVSGG